jgi:hypothetical protein
MRTTGSHRYVVRKSGPGLGHGLFAATTVKRGDFIAEYTGKRIPTSIADASKSRYLFELDEDWTINGEARSNIARYINHSCRPNVEAEIEDGRILIYATRTVQPGEEFLIDYGEEYFDEFIRPIGCKCPSCSVVRV